MARLLSVRGLIALDDHVWYSTQDRWTEQHARYKAWPNRNYPLMHAFFYEDMDRPTVNFFIEDHLQADVLYCVHDFRYWFKRDPKDWKEEGRSIDNLWYTFHFRNEADHLLFKLNFPKVHPKPTWAHPSGDYPREYGPNVDFDKRWEID